MKTIVLMTALLTTTPAVGDSIAKFKGDGIRQGGTLSYHTKWVCIR